MTEKPKIRAAIDAENVKGLLFINGAGAITILALLPFLMDNPDFDAMSWAALCALVVFQAGVVLAVIHNRLRRVCALAYERYDDRPPACRILGLSSPCVCVASTLCLWLSVVAFMSGGVIVAAGGARALHHAETSESKEAALPIHFSRGGERRNS